ncbi:MAG TPA: serine hydrolase [Gemmatimonadales bacterium]|jgi:CubicO group peptidase (beta-lactamase class C family)|nr:serine hydrolase [Gemmatimonadales bacterium]
MRSRTIPAGLLLSVLAASPCASQDRPAPTVLRASLVAGYHAAFLCSAVYLAHRDPDAVRNDELGPTVLDQAADTSPGLRPARVGVDRTAHTAFAIPATADDPFFRGQPRLAVFQAGRGCTLLPPGAKPEDAARLPAVPRWSPPDVAARPWPDGDHLPIEPLPAQVDSARLHAALDSAFSGSAYRPSRTLGVVVVYRGRIVAERYAAGWGMHTQYRTWSTAKSIASALIGILVGQGKLSVDAPAPILEWSRPLDPRSSITIEHLLHMSSGLESGGNQTPIGYWGGIDIAADAASAPLERAPGTRWKYSNYDTILLLRAARQVLGDEAYAAFPRQALLDRIGMYHTFPETDPYGNYILSSQVYSTPRDLARLGLLYLNDGVWNGRRILPPGWVAYTVKPAPAYDLTASSPAWGYGAQWWLIGRDSRVPSDAYTTQGRRGQFATVIPSRRVVVVRTGLDPEPTGWDHAGFVGEVVSAIGR